MVLRKWVQIPLQVMIMLMMMHSSPTIALVSSVNIPCSIDGQPCSLQADAWCENSLRVRLRLGTEGVLDNLPGALAGSEPSCGVSTSSSLTTSDEDRTIGTFTNGALTIAWSELMGLQFMVGDSTIFQTDGSIDTAFMLKPVMTPPPKPPSPPPPPPPPPPSPHNYTCQESCTSGPTGINATTDIVGCDNSGLNHPVVANTTTTECCGLCSSNVKCVAWAWGNDKADSDHRYKCFMCSNIEGTTARSDRNFGCVPRRHTAASSFSTTTTSASSSSSSSSSYFPTSSSPSSFPSYSSSFPSSSSSSFSSRARGKSTPANTTTSTNVHDDNRLNFANHNKGYSDTSTQHLNATFFETGATFTIEPAEVITGLGQHSYVPSTPCSTGKECGQWKLDQKGFMWPLEITKYQIMVPFYVSSKRYGLFWNHAGDGTVSVTNTSVMWNSTLQKQIDFWVTAAPPPVVGAGRDRGATNEGQSPFTSILGAYTNATGRAPVLPEFATGFWQSKMRYRTTDELLDVARGYSDRNISLSVIVIDFYSWTKFGDFEFDKRCWPNISDATKLLGNTKILRSTYPWVDNTSTSYHDALRLKVLARTENNTTAYPAPIKIGLIDPFATNTQEFVWSRCKKSFFDEGIEMFWLDDAEPNVAHTGLVYACGPSKYCGALWANKWVGIFQQGVKSAGVASPVMLSRAAWAGFQTTGAVLWSSDIPSTFESLQVQLRAGLNTMMSGIPWWTTDVGGFTHGNTSTPYFRELIVRWYQFGIFSPVFRTHGARANVMPALPTFGERYHESGVNCTAPGGHKSGGPNEIWEFGNETEIILAGLIKFREQLRPYISELAVNVSTFGTPPMRPMFFDFPDDENVWAIDDQFMFGPSWLVAPVLYEGSQRRDVYFPANTTWKHFYTKEVYAGGVSGAYKNIETPLETFPALQRM